MSSLDDKPTPRARHPLLFFRQVEQLLSIFALIAGLARVSRVFALDAGFLRALLASDVILNSRFVVEESATFGIRAVGRIGCCWLPDFKLVYLR